MNCCSTGRCTITASFNLLPCFISCASKAKIYFPRVYLVCFIVAFLRTNYSSCPAVYALVSSCNSTFNMNINSANIRQNHLSSVSVMASSFVSTFTDILRLKNKDNINLPKVMLTELKMTDVNNTNLPSFVSIVDSTFS